MPTANQPVGATQRQGSRPAMRARRAAFGRISQPDEAWLARLTPEAAIEPDLPILDAHHHLWRKPDWPYGLPEFQADIACGHQVVGTVFIEAHSQWYEHGPEELRPVGETAAVACAAALDPRVATGIVAYADLTLGDHIAAGDEVLRRTNEQTIPAMEAQLAANPGDDLAPQRLRDLRGARDELDRRVHDLRLTRQVAMQALPSIRLIQENDKALSSKIHSVLANTVPLWRQQLAQALAIHRMREAGQAVKEATDLTNRLLTANAETLRRGNQEARTEVERGVFDLEAVQKANAALVATIEDSLTIADQARGQRARAAEELEKLEQDIRRVLTQAKGSAVGKGQDAAR